MKKNILTSIVVICLTALCTVFCGCGKKQVKSNSYMVESETEIQTGKQSESSDSGIILESSSPQNDTSETAPTVTVSGNTVSGNSKNIKGAHDYENFEKLIRVIGDETQN